MPADGSSGGDSAELSQVIPRIIKPRKRRKKEKKPKIPRRAAAAEERNSGGVVGRWERRPSSLGTDTQSSSESVLSAIGGEWYLSGEHLDALCAELTTLRLRRQLTPPELALTPPDSPGAAGWRQLGGLRRSRSEPTHRAQLDDRRSFSCPSSLEFRESPPGEGSGNQAGWIWVLNSDCVFFMLTNLLTTFLSFRMFINKDIKHISNQAPCMLYQRNCDGMVGMATGREK